MFKYTLKITIILILLGSGITVADEIFTWIDENGVEHYSNDPTQVPFSKWISSANKQPSSAEDNNVTEGTDYSKISENLPESSKEHLNKYIQAELQLQKIITAKKEELEDLKKQKDVSKEEVIKLENFVLQAEDKLKSVQEEKNKFLIQNNLTDNP